MFYSHSYQYEVEELECKGAITLLCHAIHYTGTFLNNAYLFDAELLGIPQPTLFFIFLCTNTGIYFFTHDHLWLLKLLSHSLSHNVWTTVPVLFEDSKTGSRTCPKICLRSSHLLSVCQKGLSKTGHTHFARSATIVQFAGFQCLDQRLSLVCRKMQKTLHFSHMAIFCS